MAHSAETIIEADDLVKHFSGASLVRSAAVVRAVDGVSLSVRRGETFAIVGEAGCGKSTLARLLVRLIDPTSGRIVYDGADLTGLSNREMHRLRAKVQFVFQDPFSSLNPRMTVGKLVEEPLLIHTKLSRAGRRQRVASLLVRVGLRADYAKRYPHEFSGGQRQRIGIARALASEPDLLIGDEPVSALDVSVQAQIINLVEDLKDEFGLTLIIIAHDLAVIRHMSDRVAVMYLGKIVELAGVDELFERPQHPYTQALLQAIPVPAPGANVEHVPLAGDIPSPVAPPSGCRFHTRCPYAVERCSESEPPLAAESGHLVACHRAAELSLEGVSVGGASNRSPAATRRFELYRKFSRQAGAITD